MRRLGVALVWEIGLIACASSAPPPRPPTVTMEPPPTCAGVAAHLIEVLRGAPGQTPQRDVEASNNLRNHCIEGFWAAKSLRCFVAAVSPQEATRCFQGLTDSQQAAFAQPPRERYEGWAEWRDATAKSQEEHRAWELLPKEQRGPRPAVPPPPPPPPPPPHNLSPAVFETHRVAGDKRIPPTPATHDEIVQSGKDRVIGSYKLCVNKEGDVSSVTVIRSTGFQSYDQTIGSTIRNEWRYLPFLENDKPSKVCSAVTLIYTSSNAPSSAPPPSPAHSN